MAFLNNKTNDSKAILEKSFEEQQDILRAFATGSTIETISEVTGLSVEEITAFLNNRTDEIIALKDFYSKVFNPVETEINEINEKAVFDNDDGKRN